MSSTVTTSGRTATTTLFSPKTSIFSAQPSGESQVSQEAAPLVSPTARSR
jgi:hypothetical protein